MADNKNYMDKLGPKLDYVTVLQDVLALFEQVIDKNIHVASMAVFKEVVQAFDSNKGYGIIKVAPIPLEKSRPAYTINAYHIVNYSFNSGDLVPIIYSDLNFEKNLNYGKNSQVEADDNFYHSQMNAIALPPSAKGDPGPEGPEGPEGPQGPAGPAIKVYKHSMIIKGKETYSAYMFYIEALTLDSSSYEGFYWDDLTKLMVHSMYRVDGTNGVSTYKILEYMGPDGRTNIYEEVNHYPTIYIEINLNMFEIAKDVCTEVK